MIDWNGLEREQEQERVHLAARHRSFRREVIAGDLIPCDAHTGVIAIDRLVDAADVEHFCCQACLDELAEMSK